MKVSLYIPSNSHGKILSKSVINSTLLTCASIFAKNFGGATVQNSVGFYMDSTDTIIQEDIKILYSNAKKISLKQKDIIRELGLIVKNSLRQESVMIEFGDTPEFI